MKKTAKDYMSQPYSMVVRKDVLDGIFVAKVLELPGCTGHGETAESALKMLEANMEVWIETCLESGTPIPEPQDPEELPSGKWLQRAPRHLHSELVRLAEADEVSLNHYVVAALAKEVGRRLGRIENETIQLNASARRVHTWESLVRTKIDANWIVAANVGADRHKDLIYLNATTPSDQEQNKTFSPEVRRSYGKTRSGDEKWTN